MDLRSYPFDDQECKAELEMYKFSDDVVSMQWFSSNAVEFPSDGIQFNTFSLVHTKTEECYNENSSGEYR